MSRQTITTSEPREFEELEQYRTEVNGYCYRMLGSAFDAQDAAQETFVRAWKGLDRFEGRASLRSWLYRIATNVCFDMTKGKQRRALPMDLGPASTASATLGDALPEATWIEPMPDGLAVPSGTDPAERVAANESIRLAFVTALQYLPPRQRAVLLLRDVLKWRASEVAVLLDTTVASVNSALQRAHATLGSHNLAESTASETMSDENRALLERYVDAFERYDIEAFVSLLQQDATQTMPPYALWLRGPVEISKWMLGPGIGCKGSRLLPTAANGAPGFAQYKPSGPGGRLEPWALHVVELEKGQVAGITYFLDTAAFFPLFGMPDHL
jgi:RNA polymerase sigma-70 factor (ECF subfamily)